MVAHPQVTLLPKLQVQFAEFLQHRSLNRLSILYLPTSVGLRYGLINLSAISWNLFKARVNPIRHALHEIRHA